MSASPPRTRRPIGSFPLVLVAASIVLLIGAAVVIMAPSRPSQLVAGATDIATGTAAGAELDTQQPPTTDASAVPGQTEQPIATPGSPAGGGGPTPPPGPGRTPRPTLRPTPIPGLTPTPAPTPMPTATPTPTPPPPTPTPMPTTCTVPDFANMNTNNISPIWTGAGFTGTITYSPAVPPQFKVAWQSLAAGSSVACTSGIEVRKVAP
jgi:hypothetical protein